MWPLPSVLRHAFLVSLTAVSLLFSPPQLCRGTSPEMTVAEIVEEQAKGVLLIFNVGPLNLPQPRGSGFVVKSNGVLVTNHHVFEGARALKVHLPDGQELDVVGSIALEPELDLAVLKIDAAQLATVTLGDSDSVKVGERVIAMGSPLGLENTVSDGLLSAIRKDDENVTGSKLKKLFQISAPISPGSSGGPLFNMRGEVVGITVAGMPEGQNLNFAIPINYAKGLIRDGPIQPLGSVTGSKSPFGCPVVGNQRSRIHGQFYGQMQFSPDGVCFQSEEEAQRKGYRRSLR